MGKTDESKTSSIHDNNPKGIKINESTDEKLKNSKKSNHSKPLLFFMIALTAILLFIFLSKRSILDTNLTKRSLSGSQNTSDTGPNDTITDLPTENSIYISSDGSLFYINYLSKQYVEKFEVKSDEYRGYVTLLDKSTGKYGRWEQCDFRDLKNPKLLYSSTSVLYSIVNSLKSTDGSNIYLSVVFLNAPENNKMVDLRTEKNTILQIDTIKGTAKEIWSNSMMEGSRYKDLGGAVYIEEVVNNKFLIFDISNCYHCEGYETNTIVLNINTGKEKFYEGVIDEIRVDIERNTISYKKTQRLEQDCDFYACGPTLKTIDEIMVDTLP